MLPSTFIPFKHYFDCVSCTELPELIYVTSPPEILTFKITYQFTPSKYHGHGFSVPAHFIITLACSLLPAPIPIRIDTGPFYGVLNDYNHPLLLEPMLRSSTEYSSESAKVLFSDKMFFEILLDIVKTRPEGYNNLVDSINVYCEFAIFIDAVRKHFNL